MEKFEMIFNQDCSSICALNDGGARLFAIKELDHLDEIYNIPKTSKILIAQRLFRTALVAVVTCRKPRLLRLIDYKLNRVCCEMEYKANVVLVRMNRDYLVAYTDNNEICIHKMCSQYVLRVLRTGDAKLCALSLGSELAFPATDTGADLRIFDINKGAFRDVVIEAHRSKLSALDYSPNGAFLATASERGTVIRVFCAKTGQRIQEFRRGQRYVDISSLIFSTCGNFLCVASNRQTVHVFRIDEKIAENAHIKTILEEEHRKAQRTAAKKQRKEPEKRKTKPHKQQQQNQQNQQPQQQQQQQQQQLGIEATESNILATAYEDTAAASGTAVAEPAKTANGTETLRVLGPDETEPPSTWSGYLTRAITSVLPTELADEWQRTRNFASAALPQPGLKLKCALTKIEGKLHLLVACDDGFLYVYDFDAVNGGICQLLHLHDLRGPMHEVVEVTLTDCMQQAVEKAAVIDTQARSDSLSVESFNDLDYAAYRSCLSEIVGSANNANSQNFTYASILKGKTAPEPLTDSTKLRIINDDQLPAVIDPDAILYDECEFPPVALAAKN